MRSTSPEPSSSPGRAGAGLLSVPGSRTLVLSGLTGTDRDGRAPAGDAPVQAQLALTRLDDALASAGATRDDLVKVSVLATDAAVARRPEIDAILAAALPGHVAVAWIRVVALDEPSGLLTLDAVAAPRDPADAPRYPDSLVVVRPEERGVNPNEQTRGMRRESGATPETVGSVTLWSGWVTTPPGMDSGPHHHGDAESAIYMLQGQARFSWGDRLQHARIAGPGDFIYVPPRVIHAEKNLSETEPVVFVVSRNSGTLTTVNVDLDTQEPRS